MILLKKKTIKEIIYVKKYECPQVDINYLLNLYKKDLDRVSECVDFFMDKIKWEYYIRIFKMCSKVADKKILTVDKISLMVREMLTTAISDYINNRNDSVYVNEFIILLITTYNGKTNISISPRVDFSK